MEQLPTNSYEIELHSKKGCIYVLVDPRNNKVMYVGSTINPVIRFKSHYLSGHPVNGEQSLKANWIRELRKSKLLPRMFVIEECIPEKMREAEIRWMYHYLSKSLAECNSFDPLALAIRAGTFNNKGERIKAKIKKHDPIIRIIEKKQPNHEITWISNPMPESKAIKLLKKRRERKGNAYYYFRPTIKTYEKLLLSSDI